MLISGYRIRTGHLVALRTKADVDTYFQTVEAYIADIPPKSANSVLKCVEKVGYEIKLIFVPASSIVPSRPENLSTCTIFAGSSSPHLYHHSYGFSMTKKYLGIFKGAKTRLILPSYTFSSVQ